MTNNILIVEDEIITAKEIEENLKEYNYNVTDIIISSNMIIKSISLNKPDLILMDIKIKGNKDGIEMAKIIKKDYDIPIIFITGFSDNDTIKKAKNTQPYGYIVKPINFNELKITIEISINKHQSDLKIRESEKKLKLFMDNATELFLILDNKLNIIQLNNTALNYINKNKQKNIQAVLPDINKIILYENLRHTYDSAKSFHITDYFKTANMGDRYLDISAFKIDSSLGMIIKDLTEMKKTEEEKKINEYMQMRYQRLASLGELSASIAHEIRQPLQVIKVITDSILYWHKLKKDIPKECLENNTKIKKISDNIVRIDNIINNLKDLTNNSQDNKKTNININNEIKNILKFYNQKLKNNSIDLELILDKNIKDILFSDIQLRLIITNILNNAIEAHNSIEKSNKIIKIKTNDKKNHILLEIADNATGISDKIIENIFDPLFTTKEKSKSSGLGLYLVNNILVSNNGSINVKNNNINGATFIINLNREVTIN